MEKYIQEFIEAVCPAAPDLYLAMFNEEVALTDATNRIRDLERRLADSEAACGAMRAALEELSSKVYSRLLDAESWEDVWDGLTQRAFNALATGAGCLVAEVLAATEALAAADLSFRSALDAGLREELPTLGPRREQATRDVIAAVEALRKGR